MKRQETDDGGRRGSAGGDARWTAAETAALRGWTKGVDRYGRVGLAKKASANQYSGGGGYNFAVSLSSSL